MSRAEKWPVASEEVAKERTLGNDEKQANNGGNDVTCGVEKEELLLVSIIAL